MLLLNSYHSHVLDLFLTVPSSCHNRFFQQTVQLIPWQLGSGLISHTGSYTKDFSMVYFPVIGK